MCVTLTERVSDLNRLGHRVQFFTDGSCQHPSSRNTRFSTFTIAIDLSIDEDTQRQAVQLYHDLGFMPTSLKIITVARTPGDQHIHRAEIYAVLTCLETFDMTRIHTDSQVVMDIIAKCRATDDPHSLYSDLTRPHPKWRFRKGNLLILQKSRLVKYYDLVRFKC